MLAVESEELLQASVFLDVRRNKASIKMTHMHAAECHLLLPHLGFLDVRRYLIFSFHEY